MRISPVSIKYSNNKVKAQVSNLSFLAHPDYERIKNRSIDIKTSSHFRRGNFFGSPSDKWKNVETALDKMFHTKEKPSVLLVGIGRGEEALSLVASIYTMKKKPKKLSKIIEMSGVDIAPKLSAEEFDKSTKFYWVEAIKEIGVAVNSFQPEEKNHGIWYNGVKFKPEIIDFVRKTLDENVLWDTSIQDFLNTNKKTYDMLVMNNVLLYMDEREKVETLKKVKEIINPKGIIITDPDDKFHNFYGIFKDWTRLASGIYQKP